MSGEFENRSEGGTERGRSPSSVPGSSGAVPSETPPARREEEVSPPPEPGAEPAEAIQGSWVPGLHTAEHIYPSQLGRRRRTPRLTKKPEGPAATLTPEQRLLVLDTWKRSGLPASDFGSLVGLSTPTLYQWRRRFETLGPGGLLDRPRGAPGGSKLPELTRRTILMLKESNPDWGCQRISDMLFRGPALPASPSAVARVLKEEGYQLEEAPTRAHQAPEPREFERAKPNQLWQTDLFTFILKRQNRRVYLVAFMDDHSRYLVGYGLHGTQSGALVLEVLRAAVASYQTPEEILSDNGAQYVTWRGKSAFSKELEKLGIHHIVSSPRHPQTLGKIERFWGSLWQECVERAVFLDLFDAQRRIGLFIDHYNFQRPHQGIGGLVPADRYFAAAPEVLRTLNERVAANALELARAGVPRAPFYLTGQAGGRSFSVHAEGERMILTSADGERKEIELVPPGETAPELPKPLCPGIGDTAGEARGAESAPGTSPIDGLLEGPPPAAEGSEKGGEA